LLAIVGRSAAEDQERSNPGVAGRARSEHAAAVVAGELLATPADREAPFDVDGRSVRLAVYDRLVDPRNQGAVAGRGGPGQAGRGGATFEESL